MKRSEGHRRTIIAHRLENLCSTLELDTMDPTLCGFAMAPEHVAHVTRATAELRLLAKKLRASGKRGMRDADRRREAKGKKSLVA